MLLTSTLACGGTDPSAAGSSGGESTATGGAETATGGAGVGTGGAGGSQVQTGGSPSAASPALLPWKLGNSWTYRVTASGAVTTKVTTIEAAELVGGSGPNQKLSAFRVVTRKGAGGMDQSVSWQALDGDRVVRYREQSFAAMTGALELEEHWAPSKLHIDSSPAHLVSGSTWLEQYEETKAPSGTPSTTASGSDVWTVVSAKQSVQVPAGTFDAVVLQKTGSGGTGAVKTYYYARGVGKVKEVGSSQIEELTNFTVSP
ncbi:MAG TPA: hypothetical protein VG937_02340 [Polyangiaceae bacterium]|nr:hypothetical protein [Polyangiaceae bacterium]